MTDTGDTSYALNYRLTNVEQRLREIETLKPAVLAERVSVLHEDVRALKRAFYVFAVSVVGSSIAFAFTVFALLGRHP